MGWRQRHNWKFSTKTYHAICLFLILFLERERDAGNEMWTWIKEKEEREREKEKLVEISRGKCWFERKTKGRKGNQRWMLTKQGKPSFPFFFVSCNKKIITHQTVSRNEWREKWTKSKITKDTQNNIQAWQTKRLKRQTEKNEGVNKFVLVDNFIFSVCFVGCSLHKDLLFRSLPFWFLRWESRETNISLTCFRNYCLFVFYQK